MSASELLNEIFIDVSLFATNPASYSSSVHLFSQDGGHERVAIDLSRSVMNLARAVLAGEDAACKANVEKYVTLFVAEAHGKWLLFAFATSHGEQAASLFTSKDGKPIALDGVSFDPSVQFGLVVPSAWTGLVSDAQARVIANHD